MACRACGGEHARSPVCERLVAVAETLELYAVPAFLTDPCNRMVWANTAFRMVIGDPIVAAPRLEGRFIPMVFLGPLRDRFPNRHAELAACLSTLDGEVDAGHLRAETLRLTQQTFAAAPEIESLARRAERPWDGTIVVRPATGPALHLRETVIPLVRRIGDGAGFHLSVWAPVESRSLPAEQPVVLDAGVASLTSRQREIALLFAAGLSAREVAERAGISTHTARDHLDAIYARLGVHSRAELAVLLVRAGAV